MLSESFLKSLSGLRLWSQKRRPGTYTGERRSTRKGRSVEFADYRNYTPGDDPRRVDWNVYARLEKPYIKLYEDEEDLTVHVLLDASASMRWNPDEVDDELVRGHEQVPGTKWQRAAELALALGHIVLASGDRLVVETSNRAHFGPKRGEASTSQLITFLEAQQNRLSFATQDSAVHRVQLNTWLRNYALAARGGMSIVISDFMDEDGFAEGLGALGAKLDLNVLHTLSEEELDPQFAGDLRLVDVENNRKQDVSLDEASFRRYRERLHAFTSELEVTTRRRGGRSLLINTSRPIEQLVLKDLRTAGWLV